MLDTSQALELGFRDLSAFDRVRYAVIGTKNSELAASNLLTLAQAERVAPQAARLGVGPLAGQIMVWAERPRQLALAIGPSRALAERGSSSFALWRGASAATFAGFIGTTLRSIHRLYRGSTWRLRSAATEYGYRAPRKGTCRRLRVFSQKMRCSLRRGGRGARQAQWLRASADSGLLYQIVETPRLQVKVCSTPRAACRDLRLRRLFKSADRRTKAELASTAAAVERLARLRRVGRSAIFCSLPHGWALARRDP